MKKSYINPNIKVVKMTTVQMLAESTTVLFGEGTKSGSAACGREFDFEEE